MRIGAPEIATGRSAGIGPGLGSRLVLATSNAGKLRELQALLGPDRELIPQDRLGVAPVEETGTTFLANALLKARHAARLTGLPALADDSGLEVDALDGAPGVLSARFAGPQSDDASNNRQLLAMMRDVPLPARTARYRCVLVCVSGADDAAPLIADGAWEGCILTAPRGAGGFGYDSLFLDPASGLSAAEMGAALKNARSHRAQALRALQLVLDARG